MELSTRLLFTVFILPFFCCGQARFYPAGAEVLSTGGVYSTVSGPIALFNNPAGIFSERPAGFSASYKLKYGLPELSHTSFGATFPFWGGKAGAGIDRSGGRLFNTTSLNLVYARKAGFATLSAKACYLQERSPERKTTHTMLAEVGGLFTLSKQFILGAHVYNLTNSGFKGEKIPVKVTFGGLYKISHAFHVKAEFSKDIDLPFEFKAGLEYNFLKILFLRTGFSLISLQESFGGGVIAGNFRINYGFSHHRMLGLEHALEVQYNIASNEK